MSGFLPDIASWALGGGAGQGEAASNDDADGAADRESGGAPAMSEEEVRAKRMARYAQAPAAGATPGADAGDGAAAGMDVDPPVTAPPAAADAEARPMDVEDEEVAKPAAAVAAEATALAPAPKKKLKSPPAAGGGVAPGAAAADPLAKLRRRKALLLRRVLLVTFGGAPADRSPACVHLALDDDEMSDAARSPAGVEVRHVAELLAARLSLDPASQNLATTPPQSKLGLIGYLGGCHLRAAGEWKELKAQGSSKAKKKDEHLEDLSQIVEEIRSQVRECVAGHEGD